LVGNWWE